MLDLLFVMVLGYAFGNIQASYILGKLLYKVDIRTLGHGNAGTSNALESVGWKFGLMVAIIDVGKGLVSVLLVKWIFDVGFDADGALLLFVNGYSAFLGHIYPIIMKFKGGKGTATMVGILMGFQPWLGLGAILIIILVTLIIDFVSISSIVLHVCVIAVTLVYGLGWETTLIATFGLLLAIYLHIPNFKRIKANTEGRLSNLLKKKFKKT